MLEKTEQCAREIQAGAYDLHVHSRPSPFGRLMDGMEILRQAEECGMAGVLLKSHYDPTAARAELINQNSGLKAKAYGGLVLNWPVGGLNPYAVENALKLGAKIIWMPTRDAANSLRFGEMEGDFFRRPGISILDGNGKLKDDVYRIMDLVKEKDAVLATGHISPEESVKLCREACRKKVRVILTHPEFPRTRVPPETQKELADQGTLIEKNWFNVAQGAVSAGEMAAVIRLVGSGRVLIATDRGQAGAPPPAEEYRNFIGALLENGLTRKELMDMSHTVPESVVT